VPRGKLQIRHYTLFLRSCAYNSEHQRIILWITVPVIVIVIVTVTVSCWTGRRAPWTVLRTHDRHVPMRAIMQFKIPLQPDNFYVLRGNFDTWYSLVFQHDYAVIWKQFKKTIFCWVDYVGENNERIKLFSSKNQVLEIFCLLFYSFRSCYLAKITLTMEVILINWKIALVKYLSFSAISRP
jgi:hypothetical protein